MSIEIIKGNLLDATEQYIAHQCNCVSSGSGAGLARAIFDKFPYSNIYKNRTEPDTPGTIIIKDNVIAILGQYYPGGPLFKGNKDTYNDRLAYFTKALVYISDIKDLKSIAFPFNIGCGLAQGKWKDYKVMIEVLNHDCKDKVKIVIYNNE